MATSAEDIKKLKVKREAARTQFSAQLQKCQDLFKASGELIEFKIARKLLTEKFKRVQEIDNSLEASIYDLEPEAMQKELVEIEEFRDLYCTMEACYDDLETPAPVTVIHSEKKSDDNDNQSVAESTASNRERSHKKLPKLELFKFGGDPQHWLKFWCSFETVHSDTTIGDNEKFQYLIQATKEGSKARRLVESYPATGENYAKVIVRLKRRFGRKNLLVDIYIRELLKIVVKRVNNPNNAVNIFELFTQIDTQVRALALLGVTVDTYAAMLYPLVESCLPQEILLTWERLRNSRLEDEMLETDEEAPEPDPGKVLRQFMFFLQKEVDSEERITRARTGFESNSRQVSQGNQRQRVRDEQSSQPITTTAGLAAPATRAAPTVTECIFCQSKDHESPACDKIKSWDVQKVREKVKEARVCYGCLKKGHPKRFCPHRKRIVCDVCEAQGHYGFTCIGERPQRGSNTTSSAAANSPLGYVLPIVYLRTLCVKLLFRGMELVARAFLDDGTQYSYISEAVANMLGLVPVADVYLKHNLFGGDETAVKNHTLFNLDVSDIEGNYTMTIPVLSSAQICKHVVRLQDPVILEEMERRGIFYTDVAEYPTKIDLLIGAHFFRELMTHERVDLESGPSCVKTKLGWTIIGARAAGSEIETTSFLSLATPIPDLWNLELLGIKDPIQVKTEEEKAEAVYQGFLENVKVLDDGRYQVSLPWLEGHPPLSSNFKGALKRLQSTVSKFGSKESFETYDAIFRDWEARNIIREIPKPNLGEGHYLAHHPVYKPESTTTPVRPVFDASCGKVSLNTCLATGPNLLSQIPHILLYFRKNQYGITADIEKAFQMIELQEEDKKFVRFLWVEGDQLKYYEHNRVVFGLTSSPFLLAATLRYHFAHASEEFHHVTEILRFYVDESFASVKFKDEVDVFIRDATELLIKGHFRLRKWAVTGAEQTARVLGLRWDCKEDRLCNTISKKICLPDTKRTLLAYTNAFYDPLGILSPALLILKLILQECWRKNLGWDVPLPKETTTQIEKFFRQADFLTTCSIPRWILGPGVDESRTSIHVFGDTSGKAYGTCIFVRSEGPDQVYVRLIQAKSRLAPTKKEKRKNEKKEPNPQNPQTVSEGKLTIPRLELMAALISARLFNEVKRVLNNSWPVTFWSDSEIVLGWIKRNDITWNTFVGNRVEEIRKTTNINEWRHVPGIMNPADLLSRGCSPKQLVESTWWDGPTWLKWPPEEWPIGNNNVLDEELFLSERKKSDVKTVVALADTTIEVNDKLQAIIERRSDFDQCIRDVAWIIRFFRWKFQKQTFKGPLQADELQNAETALWRHVQTKSFSGIGDPRLRGLLPFIDSDGLIKIKTKLIFSKHDPGFKTPIVLPHDSYLTTALIRKAHREVGHLGTQTTLCKIRTKFWVLKGRRTVNRIVNTCIPCKRYNARPMQAPPTGLPPDRINEDVACFEVAGVDLCGPLYLSDESKTWIVVFTCAVFRAVHLELVSSLSTDIFIWALRRFIARRCRPRIMYSDQGTNFGGTVTLMEVIDWELVSKQADIAPIVWKFNPPASPWWGGFWERLIRILKDMLKKILGQRTLGWEELITILCDCEAFINQRPLTYVSENADDLTALTPAHFLNERPNNQVIDFDFLDSISLSKRLIYLAKIRKSLKERFRKEYFSELVHYWKKSSPVSSVKIGEIVLVGDDDVKRQQWVLGRIVKLYPGKDSVVRMVRVKTKTKEWDRPIQRLYRLEIGGDEDDKSGSTAPQVSVPLDEIVQGPKLPKKRSNRAQEKSPKTDVKDEIKPVIETRTGRKVKPRDILDL